MKFRPNISHIRNISLVSFLLFTHCAGTGLISESYSPEFYRIPRLLPEETSEKNTRFLVYSDNQSGWRIKEKFLKKKNWNTWKMFIFPFYELYLLGNGFVGGFNAIRSVPDYGKKERIIMRDVIYSTAKQNQVDFILNVGDMVSNDGRRPRHWAEFIRENKHEIPLLLEIPYLPTLGNHERSNDSLFGHSNYHAVFDYPNFYVVESGDVAVFVVDSNYLIDQKLDIDEDTQDELFEEWFVSKGDGKKAWLENELAESDAAFKVISMHHPPISFGKHHADWRNPYFGRDLLKKRKLLLELLVKYGVQVVFSGHDHLFQHSILKSESKVNGKIGEVHFIVGGGGGTPLRGPESSEIRSEYFMNFEREGLDISLVKQGKIYHYFMVEVEEDRLVVQVYKVSMKPQVQVTLEEEVLIPKPDHRDEKGADM
jgi:hypothetical protein